MMHFCYIGLFGTDSIETSGEIAKTNDTDDADMAALPDLKAWQQLKDVSNRVPSVM